MRRLLSEQIQEEVRRAQQRIDPVRHGRVTFIVQDGVVVRVLVEEGWIPECGKMGRETAT